jgi:hypothetical protein
MFAIAACGLFFLAGLPFIPLLGIQNDEALFAYGVFPPRSGAYLLHTAHFDLPVMLMSYVGALKSWFYIPLFSALGVNIWTIRVPMLAAGAVSIWLFYLFVRDLAGERAAIAGCLLLASDPIYLLTTCFDWGPVALQHVLIWGGLVLILRSWRHQNQRALAGGFFLLGLAMWDKALAIWSLAGLLLAAVLIYGTSIAGGITGRRIATAVTAFLLAALPLIVYNLETRATTVRDTVSFDIHAVPQKLKVLERTFDGSGLFGWLVNEDGRANARRSWMVFAFCAALLLAPLSNRAERGVIGFALLAMGIAWALMAATRTGGGGLHHTILLWPLPQMVIGISITGAAERIGRAAGPPLTVLLLLVIASNFVVLNSYYRMAVRNGGAINWTDAVLALSEKFKTLPANEIFCVDWGMQASLHLLNRGSLPLLVGSEALSHAQWTLADRAQLTEMVSHPDHVFLTHTPGFEFFPGFSARLAGFAAGIGYRRETLSVLSDTHGHPTFEIYRFVAGGSQANVR